MRNLIHGLLGAILLLWASAGAQGATARAPDADYPYRMYGRAPVDRVLADLNRAARHMRFMSEDEMLRINRARDRIAVLQNKWERGHFDREQLDGLIASLRIVIDRNRLHPRDRRILLADVERLRRLRERYEREFRYR